MGETIVTEDGTCNHTGSGSSSGTLALTHQSFVKIENKKIMVSTDTMEIPSHLYAPLSYHSHSYSTNVLNYNFVLIEGQPINTNGDFYDSDFTNITSSGQSFVLVEGVVPLISIIQQAYYVAEVTGNVYNSIGTAWITGGVGGAADYSALVEGDGTIGSALVVGEVYLSDASHYPTTYEWCQVNNAQGYNGVFKTLNSVPWVAGWNKVSFSPGSIREKDLINWTTMNRLEIYAASCNGITFTFGLRNLRIIK